MADDCMHPVARERMESGDCQFCGYFDTPWIVALQPRGLPEGTPPTEVRACVNYATYFPESERRRDEANR